MRNFLKTKLLFIWIACFAILVNALAPSISYAATVGSGAPASPMREICTTGGVHAVAATAGQPDNGYPAPIDSDAHCLFCLLHGGNLGLPPSGMLALAIMAGHGFSPHLFYHAPHRLFSWAAANPRDPPRAS